MSWPGRPSPVFPGPEQLGKSLPREPPERAGCDGAAAGLSPRGEAECRQVPHLASHCGLLPRSPAAGRGAPEGADVATRGLRRDGAGADTSP